MKWNVEILAAMLERHFDSTKVMPDGTVMHIRRLVASVGEFRVHVYAHDHDPPHFHVISLQRGIDAKFNLETMSYMEHKGGRFASSDEKKIKDFFRLTPDAVQFLREEHERLTTVQQ